MSKSAFTQTHLAWLKDSSKSHLTPLAVVAHIDLDAFYAQCEQVRLGLTKKDPVVCRQWNGLIAISYAARKHGITRHETALTAHEKCKGIIFAHVATFKKGETEWKYHDNPRKGTHKVSLDPFRRESRKIFSIFKEFCSVLEKASIDETYADLGAIVHKKLLEEFPELEKLKPGDPLPDPPKICDLGGKYEWTGCIIGSCGDEHIGEKVGTDLYKFEDKNLPESTEGSDHPTDDGLKRNTPSKDEDSIPMDPSLEINDWDDICLLIGSAYIRDIRKAVLSRLDYTCSAGVARNKTLAKLASGRFKPARQTIVRASVIPTFLDTFELSDIGGLGGKLGDAIKDKLSIPESGSIQYLRDILRDQMLSKLGPHMANKIRNLVSGNEMSQVNTRTDIKSMMATKNFTNDPILTSQDAKEWLKVFAAELKGRILEISESKTHITQYPKTMNISFKCSKMPSQSKQIPFPSQVTPTTLRDTLYDLGCTLLRQIESDAGGYGAYPCHLLALGSSNFQNNSSLLASNRTLTSFFQPVKNSIQVNPDSPQQEEIEKHASTSIPPITKTVEVEEISRQENHSSEKNSPQVDDEEDDEESDLFVTELPEGMSSISTIKCDKCKNEIPIGDLNEHKDWHFAQELQELDKNSFQAKKVVTAGDTPFVKQTLSLSKQPPKTVKRFTGMTSIGSKKKKQKVDKNQTFLKF